MASKPDKQAGKDRRDAPREAPADRPWGDRTGEPAVSGYGAFHAWDVDDAPVSDRGPIPARKAA